MRKLLVVLGLVVAMMAPQLVALDRPAEAAGADPESFMVGAAFGVLGVFITCNVMLGDVFDAAVIDDEDMAMALGCLRGAVDLAKSMQDGGTGLPYDIDSAFAEMTEYGDDAGRLLYRGWQRSSPTTLSDGWDAFFAETGAASDMLDAINEWSDYGGTI